MIKIFLFFSKRLARLRLPRLPSEATIHQKILRSKIKYIWIEINNNSVSFDRYCTFGVAKKRYRLMFGKGARERERGKDGRVYIVHIHKQRAARVHPRARPTREADPRNWILLERIDRR